MLKALHAEIGSASAPAAAKAPDAAAPLPAAPAGRHATIPSRRPSSRARCSTRRAPQRDLAHRVRSDRMRARLSGRRRLRAVPRNDPALADAVLRALGAPADFPIGGRTLARGSDRRRIARARARHAVPAVLLHHRRRAAEESAGAVGRRRPRRRRGDARCARGDRKVFRRPPGPRLSSRRSTRCSLGSIRSRRLRRCTRAASRSPSIPCATTGKRKRLGVASTFLAGRVEPGDKLRVYVQKAHAFGLPADPNTPIIMIGPGTGVAPFRAFLHERMATKAPGRNWLFFGHQKRDFDFFYEDEFSGMKNIGVLDAALARMARDNDEKFSREGPHAPGRPRACGPGSPTERTSTSAAMPSAWRRTSNAH